MIFFKSSTFISEKCLSPHFTLIASMRDAQRVLFCVSGGFCLLISCVDPSLHLWGEVNCIIIAHIFYVLLNSAYKCFVEHFVSTKHEITCCAV